VTLTPAAKGRNGIPAPDVTRLRILRIVSTLGETTSSYNQFALPLRDRQRISFCSYFPATVRPPPEIRFFQGDGSVPGFLRALRSAFREGAYEIVHAHAVVVAVLFLLANLVYGQPLRTTVFTLHTSYEILKLRNRLLLVPILLLFRRIVCCSTSSLRSLPALLRRIGGKRLVAIANGVDVERVDRTLAGCSERASARSNFSLISVGRLIAIKNPGAMLAAFQRCGGGTSRFTVVGDGHLRAQLEAWVSTAGLDDRVTFTGLVSRQRVYEELRAADAFISTSHGEGLPIAVMEAMACRRPVILSDIPAHREIADELQFIPLVPPDDVAGFAREIERLRDAPASERARIGESCRKLVEQRFSLEAMHGGYAEVYREITEQRAS
jgi:glycosyltransferase involved in cell wall biosynthesis